MSSLIWIEHYPYYVEFPGTEYSQVSFTWTIHQKTYTATRPVWHSLRLFQVQSLIGGLLAPIQVTH